MRPKVSIISSVYSGEKWLCDTIESVLSQTFTDFEFIIVDDGSTDETSQIIDLYAKKDSRIRLIINKKNLGLTKSLNKGIGLAKGKYIARIDAGDKWKKEKLKKQFSFLEIHKDYVICGTQVLFIDDEGKELGEWRGPTEDKELRKTFLTRTGIYVHPSIVFRNTGILYRDFFEQSQDLDLYMRLSFFGKLYSLSEVLTICTASSEGLTIKKKYYQRQYQNIAYRLFKQRIRKGRDDLDERRVPLVHRSKIGEFLCRSAMFFYLEYTRAKTRKKVVPIWILFLILSFIIYPPLAFDYWNKLTLSASLYH